MLEYSQISMKLSNEDYIMLEEIIHILDNIEGLVFYNYEDYLKYKKTAPKWEVIDEDSYTGKKDYSIIYIYTLVSNANNLLKELNNLLKNNSIVPLEISLQKVENIDWNKKWKESYKPFELGEFLICPSWIDSPETDKKVITIDPSTAFGTGTHETTANCIRLISKLDLSKKNVLDYGCGSGILAIACKKKGADVCGIDIDYNATKTSIYNSNINNVDINFATIGENHKLNDKYDLIIANILHNIILEKLDDIYTSLVNDGMLIASGIINQKSSVMEDAFKGKFKVQEKILDNDWCTYLLRKVNE